MNTEQPNALELIDENVEIINDDHPNGQPLDFYLILIADDNLEVHHATRIALQDVIINERRLLLMDAYSGAEAMLMIRRGIPFDLVLLDMVMETQDAGMIVAKQIQSHYGISKPPAVIMRTGQPGNFKHQDVSDNIWFDEFMIKSFVTKTRLVDIVTKYLSPPTDDGITRL